MKTLDDWFLARLTQIIGDISPDEVSIVKEVIIEVINEKEKQPPVVGGNSLEQED